MLDPNHTFPSHWRDMPAAVVDRPEIIIDPAEQWTQPKSKVVRKYSTYMALVERFDSDWSSGVLVRFSRHITVRDNEISNFTTAVQLERGSAWVTVERNHIHHCRTGIFTWGPAPSLASSVIRANLIEQSLTSGIVLRKRARDVRIEGNQLRYNAIGQIGVHDESSNNVVARNVATHGGFYSETMEHPGSSAITIHVAGSGNVVDGNVAAYQTDPTEQDGSGLFADLMRGAPVSSVNNIFSLNRVAGVQLVSALAEQKLIDHNLYDQPTTPLIRQGGIKRVLEYRAIAQIPTWERQGLTVRLGAWRYQTHNTWRTSISRIARRVRGDVPAAGCRLPMPGLALPDFEAAPVENRVSCNPVARRVPENIGL